MPDLCGKNDTTKYRKRHGTHSTEESSIILWYTILVCRSCNDFRREVNLLALVTYIYSGPPPSPPPHMLGEAGWGGWGLGGSSLSPKLNYLHVSITMPYHEHAMIYAVNSTCHRCSKNTQPLWIYPNMFIEFYSLLQVEFYDCVQWVQFDKGKVYIGPPPSRQMVSSL